MIRAMSWRGERKGGREGGRGGRKGGSVRGKESVSSWCIYTYNAKNVIQSENETQHVFVVLHSEHMQE